MITKHWKDCDEERCLVVKEVMKAHGFDLTESGGGCQWYTKKVRDGFIAITDQVSGIEAPVSIEDAVIVGFYDKHGLDTDSVYFDQLDNFLKLIGD